MTLEDRIEQEDRAYITRFLVGHMNRSARAIRDDRGKTALHYAVDGAPGLLEILLDSMSLVDVRAQDLEGNTALHIAVQRSVHTEQIKLLLSHMSEESIDLRNAMGRTALHEAAELGRHEVVQGLVSRMSR